MQMSFPRHIAVRGFDNFTQSLAIPNLKIGVSTIPMFTALSIHSRAQRWYIMKDHNDVEWSTWKKLRRIFEIFSAKRVVKKVKRNK